eukprot:4281355-Prymnesium_polylepis.1
MAASVHATQAALHATAAATHATNAVTQMSEMSVRQTMEARHRKTIATQKRKLEKDSADGKRPLSKFICADDDFLYFEE